ncbi:hypothetical protein [Flavobacterium ginsenosidimutans]|uniref:Lipoprotein n=1 Tax=Flavobacterium ginsenosidimutans TaxID=687844 RepID=A0ABZ2QD84_9FLAO
MKNITLILFLVLGFAVGCSSDEDGKSGVNSSIVIDGITFKPNKAVYSYQPASFESQKRVRFVISNEGMQEFLYIDISFPATQKSLTGEYSFGIGTADELLAMVEFYAPDKRYYISGYSLKITDNGDSNFNFEFVSPEVYDGINNKKVNFKGALNGKIVME